MRSFAAAMLCTNTANAAVEISTKPTANMSCSGGVCIPTTPKAVLNVNDLAGMLAGGDTTIKSISQNPEIEIRHSPTRFSRVANHGSSAARCVSK